MDDRKAFHWKKDVLDKIPESEYLKVGIRMSGYYSAGDKNPGWISDEKGSYDVRRREFDSHLSTLSQKFGYVVEARNSYSSPQIKGSKRGDRSSIYMHPMYAEGYATKEFIQNLLDEFKTSQFLTGLSVDVTPVLALNDTTYCDVLKAHAKPIADYFIRNPHDDAFDFLSRHGLKYAFQKHGLSSSDMDVIMVETIRDLAKEFGYKPRQKQVIKGE